MFVGMLWVCVCVDCVGEFFALDGAARHDVIIQLRVREREIERVREE